MKTITKILMLAAFTAAFSFCTPALAAGGQSSSNIFVLIIRFILEIIIAILTIFF